MNYTPLPAIHRKRSTKRNGIGSLVLILTAVTASYTATSWTLNSMFRTDSRASAQTAVLAPPPAGGSQLKTSNLDTVVEKSLAGSKGTYAILIKNLKTDETYAFNEHKTFEAGSLYKLWIMATVYEQVEEGILALDDPLHVDIPALNEAFKIATEDAELTEGEINFTIESALKQMITISHNYAALALTRKVKIANVKAFLKKHNLEESFTGSPPKVSAYDIGAFLEKLYNHQLVSTSSDGAMISLLKQQTLNNKIPVLLPSETVIAHKTGEIGMFSHDGGIVYSPGGDYIIVVLSLSNNPAGANERIATLSEAVYDYFNE